jgi:hypothetical protein
VTLSCLKEVLHFAIKATYRSEIPNYLTGLGVAFPRQARYDWIDLYKIEPGILQGFHPDLTQLRRLMVAKHLLILQPEDLLRDPTGRSWEQALIDVIGLYGLDSSDASLLLEARKVSVFSIATLDPDLRRSAVDFDIYTWL